jgi:hypothetical protein
VEEDRMAEAQDKRSGKSRRTGGVRESERRKRETPVKEERRSGTERRIDERREKEDRRKE